MSCPNPLHADNLDATTAALLRCRTAERFTPPMRKATEEEARDEQRAAGVDISRALWPALEKRGWIEWRKPGGYRLTEAGSAELICRLGTRRTP